MIIPEEPRPVPRRFTIVHCSLQIGPIQLAPNQTVTTGTPIRPGKGGWEVCRDGQDIWAYVGTPPSGASQGVDAWREVVAEVGAVSYPSGARLSVKFVNDDGLASLVPDPNGHIATIGRTRILLLPRITPYVAPIVQESMETDNAGE